MLFHGGNASMTQQTKTAIIPSQKLISKERSGAKVTKKYDIAQTPAQRLLARDDITKETKTLLKNTFLELNPVALLYAIYDLVEELYDTLHK